MSPVTLGEIGRSLSLLTVRPANSQPVQVGEKIPNGLNCKLLSLSDPLPGITHFIFVQREKSLFRIPTTGKKIRLSIPQELEYIFIKISLFVRCVFKRALH